LHAEGETLPASMIEEIVSLSTGISL